MGDLICVCCGQTKYDREYKGKYTCTTCWLQCRLESDVWTCKFGVPDDRFQEYIEAWQEFEEYRKGLM
jgi:hypothetical protein